MVRFPLWFIRLHAWFRRPSAHFMGTCWCQHGRPTAGEVMRQGFEEAFREARRRLGH